MSGAREFIDDLAGYRASQGLAATSYEGYGADPQSELVNLIDQVFDDYPNSVCFASRIVFRKENLFTSLLHNQMPIAVQRRLHEQNRKMIIVPVKIEEDDMPSNTTRVPVH